MVAWHRFDPDARRLTLTVHVQPNAAASAVAGLHGDALKIRIAAPAVDNKANAALVDFLRHLLKLPASRIGIRHGAHGRFQENCEKSSDEFRREHVAHAPDDLSPAA